MESSRTSRERILEEQNQNLKAELRSNIASRNSLTRDHYLLMDRLEKLEGFSTSVAQSLKSQLQEAKDMLNRALPETFNSNPD